MRSRATATTIRAVITTGRPDPVAGTPAAVVGAIRFVITQADADAIVISVAAAGNDAAGKQEGTEPDHEADRQVTRAK
jgi:hypothetical protein